MLWMLTKALGAKRSHPPAALQVRQDPRSCDVVAGCTDHTLAHNFVHHASTGAQVEMRRDCILTQAAVHNMKAVSGINSLKNACFVAGSPTLFDVAH